jgi:hypothetical protein
MAGAQGLSFLTPDFPVYPIYFCRYTEFTLKKGGGGYAKAGYR